MKITIEINEQEIIDAVKEKIIENAVKQVQYDLFQNEFSNYHRNVYRKEVKDAIRDVIKENKEDLAKRAVNAAAVSIRSTALKKKLNDVLEDV
jgi:hypothetical protein